MRAAGGRETCDRRPECKRHRLRKWVSAMVEAMTAYKDATVGRRWGERHPFGAAAIFFCLWIVAVVGLAGLLNPVLTHALAGQPAWLRVALEAESLIAVAIPSVACTLMLGSFGREVPGARQRQRGETRAGEGVAPHRDANAGRPPAVGRAFCRLAGAFAGGLLAGIAWFVLAFGALLVAGLLSAGAPAAVPALPLWIAACFTNAAFQEILVRGYAFGALARGGGVAAATAVTTLAFVLFHPGAFACGPVSVLQIAAASVLLTEVRLVTHGLAAPIAMHAAWNALGGIGFGVVALADDYPRVFDTTIGGPACVSGGAMGLEGSVVTLLITCALCFAAALLRAALLNRGPHAWKSQQRRSGRFQGEFAAK